MASCNERSDAGLSGRSHCAYFDTRLILLEEIGTHVSRGISFEVVLSKPRVEASVVLVFERLTRGTNAAHLA